KKGFKDAMYRTFKYEPLILCNIFHIQLEDTLSHLSIELLNQINSLSQRIMTMIADVYEEGVRQGKFSQGRGMVHADIIWAIFTGLVLWEEAKRKLNPKKDFLKTTLDRAFDIFCRGIK
ncbi:MAG TPA: TetR/AcrR family transcriptional regulator, partial [Desulfobacteraceae bacterium]|nr:TetR/AcrR family transcriptional regulator [Desulfobacteraceae bacterium]